MMRALRKSRPEADPMRSGEPLQASTTSADLPEPGESDGVPPSGELPSPGIADLERQLRAHHAMSHTMGDGTRLPLPKLWQFLCLAEIANFSALRRHLGRARANQLPIDVSARINASLGDARISIVGR